MKIRMRYQWVTALWNRMPAMLFSLSNSRNTLVVVRRSVKGKYTESARLMASDRPLTTMNTHLQILW